MENKQKTPKFDGRSILLALLLIVNCLIIFGFAIESSHSFHKMEELVGQMSYLSDTNSILLTDLGNLRTELAEYKADSESLLEGWSISLRDMDFERETYTVDIQMVPKEYTDTMTMTIYFGTRPVSLKREEFRYVGSAELSLEESFDNNVALLLADGGSRKTEVLSDYADVRTDLTNVLYGALSEEPDYEEGNLKLNGSGYVRLDAGDFFTFRDLELVVTCNKQTVASYDLAAMAEGDMAGDAAETAGEEDTESLFPEEGQPLTWLAYTYLLEKSIPVEEAGEVSIYLRANAENGFVFCYELATLTLEEAAEDNRKDAVAAESDNELQGPVQEGIKSDPEADRPEDAASVEQLVAENAGEISSDENGEDQKPQMSEESGEAAGEEVAQDADTAKADAEEKSPAEKLHLQIAEGSLRLGGRSTVYDPQGHIYVLQEKR